MRRSRRRAFAVAALAAALALGAAPGPAQAAPAASTAPGVRVPQLSSATAERAIEAAESQKGTPYAWGGNRPGGFDCSGLVQWSFKQAGVNLPRIAQDQVNAGTRIGYSSARRGDLLYWTDSGGYAYHVAIYLGNGRMIDAPRTGDKVRERDVTRYNLAGAVRL
ncbi:hypothetical protein SUDANB121_02647 [Nocardiopsis dassonvillei]